MSSLRARFTIEFWRDLGTLKANDLRTSIGPVLTLGEIEQNGVIRVEKVLKTPLAEPLSNNLNAVFGAMYITNSIDELIDTTFSQLQDKATEFFNNINIQECAALMIGLAFFDLKTYKVMYNFSVATPTLDQFPISFHKHLHNSEPCIQVCIPITEKPIVNLDEISESDSRLFYRLGTLSVCAKKQIIASSDKSDEFFIIKFDKSISQPLYIWKKEIQGSYLTVDLSAFLDKEILASDLYDLNVKMIKWRSVPALDLSIFRKKILMLGSGTLGCACALCLIGYGFTNICFIDSGTVGYSNISRQWLFNKDDADSAIPKAKAAADNLCRKIPVKYRDNHGIPDYMALRIPMPGHVTDCNSIKDLIKLENLVAQSDAVFLVTDSRESRYLPTVLSAVHEKPAITAALGFDSFLCNLQLRVKNSNISSCYFCGDDHGINDSLTNRPLDEQCTVTRPGVSPMASAIATEMLVSYFSSPEVFSSSSGLNTVDIGDSRSGILGNSITRVRGWMDKFTTYPSSPSPVDRCIACSSPVLAEYRTNPATFLYNICSDTQYLMNISGKQKEIDDINLDDIINFD